MLFSVRCNCKCFCFLILTYLYLVDCPLILSNQTKRAIPIHFKVRRPQNPEKETDAEDDEDVSGREGGGNHRGNGQYEGGMGGRARGGEWQVEMPPTARDPRDAARALRQAAVEPAAFVTAGRAFEDSLEEYPALAKVGGGALTVGGWGSSNNNNNNKKQDFPALGPGPGVRGAGGGGAGRSFSGATTGSYIREGKVGGVGSQGATDDSWAITNKKAKRLTPSGGVSKPASSSAAVGGWGKGQGQEEEADAASASKVDNYPSLSKGPKAYR